ncbi:hypothetical protein HI914_04458 [Erysiphe necator]|nr:hypothetical protein HI914_04458 [Erysiphe necator]
MFDDGDHYQCFSFAKAQHKEGKSYKIDNLVQLAKFYTKEFLNMLLFKNATSRVKKFHVDNYSIEWPYLLSFFSRNHLNTLDLVFCLSISAALTVKFADAKTSLENRQRSRLRIKG